MDQGIGRGGPSKLRGCVFSWFFWFFLVFGQILDRFYSCTFFDLGLSFWFKGNFSYRRGGFYPWITPGAKSYGQIWGRDISVDRWGPKESKNEIKKFYPIFWILTQNHWNNDGLIVSHPLKGYFENFTLISKIHNVKYLYIFTLVYAWCRIWYRQVT